MWYLVGNRLAVGFYFTWQSTTCPTFLPAITKQNITAYKQKHREFGAIID